MDDLTTHQSGFMQASAANGFQTTSMADCSGTPFNFQPEFNTAKASNINSWGALQVDISTEFETGHWEACTSLSDPIAQPGRPERHQPDVQRVQRPVRERRPAGRHHARGRRRALLPGRRHPSGLRRGRHVHASGTG